VCWNIIWCWKDWKVLHYVITSFHNLSKTSIIQAHNRILTNTRQHRWVNCKWCTMHIHTREVSWSPAQLDLMCHVRAVLLSVGSFYIWMHLHCSKKSWNIQPRLWCAINHEQFVPYILDGTDVHNLTQNNKEVLLHSLSYYCTFQNPVSTWCFCLWKSTKMCVQFSSHDGLQNFTLTQFSSLLTFWVQATTLAVL